MQLNNAMLSLAALGAMLSVSASAQTRFCLGGDLDHLTHEEKKSCSSKLETVRTLAGSMHAPGDWHFVVVCGEDGWKSYANFKGQEGAALLNSSADTDLDQHETFFRADRISLNDAQSLRVVVAHELAAIVLHTTDQQAIERQIASWTAKAGNASGI
jgi:hypothetical protein